MQFFLYEVVARVVAAYLCYDCGYKLWYGLAERKIGYMGNGDWLGLLLDWVDWSKMVIHRDTAPIRYWLQIFVYATAFLGCLGVAILGWWHPDN